MEINEPLPGQAPWVGPLDPHFPKFCTEYQHLSSPSAPAGGVGPLSRFALIEGLGGAAGSIKQRVLATAIMIGQSASDLEKAE